MISLDQRVNILERYLFSKLDMDSWGYMMSLDQRIDISERCLLSKLDKNSRRLYDEFRSESGYIGDILVLQA